MLNEAQGFQHTCVCVCVCVTPCAAVRAAAAQRDGDAAHAGRGGAGRRLRGHPASPPARHRRAPALPSYELRT